jgi:hypothetical protein
MLKPYRVRESVPAVPAAQIAAGTEKDAPLRAVPAVPAVPAEKGKARAANVLERFAKANGIDWTAARSQMILGDAEAGAAQLAADTGDGVECAGVACWLHLLAERETPAHEPWPTGYRTRGTGLDAYGQPLTSACQVVTCGSCQHFQHDPINPPAGVGACREGVGHLSVGSSLHPMAARLCDHHKSLP